MFLSEKFNTQFYCCLTGLHLTGGSRAPKVARPMAKCSKSVWTGLASILKPKRQSFNGKFLEKQKNKNSLSLHCFTFFPCFFVQQNFSCRAQKIELTGTDLSMPLGLFQQFLRGLASSGAFSCVFPCSIRASPAC